MNGSRRRLRRLVADHTVSTIVVEHRERLCRFGFEYVEAALAGRGARILVMEDSELEDDLVGVIARNRGDDFALCQALRAAFGPASRAASVGSSKRSVMKATYQTRHGAFQGHSYPPAG